MSRSPKAVLVITMPQEYRRGIFRPETSARRVIVCFADWTRSITSRMRDIRVLGSQSGGAVWDRVEPAQRPMNASAVVHGLGECQSLGTGQKRVGRATGHKMKSSTACGLGSGILQKGDG